MGVLKDVPATDFMNKESFNSGKPLALEFVHADGSKVIILTNHTYNAAQIEWFKAGSALNLIKQQQA